MYRLRGALPAGAYHLHADGDTQSTTAKLHADLVFRHAGAPDATIGGIDSTPQPPGFHLQPWLDGDVHAPALAAQPRDALLVRIDYVSGTGDFTVIETSLTIP
ncbi:MAG TPA: hypothetical protein VJ891_18930 [Casimicrobiaceae bacterium]|nr:hypothetical protein [Casimicrobiaceae bacterium]